MIRRIPWIRAAFDKRSFDARHNGLYRLGMRRRIPGSSQPG